MKKKLHKMNYKEYIDYLKDNNVNFNEHIKDGFLSGQEVQVIPISEKEIPRSFDKESQPSSTAHFTRLNLKFYYPCYGAGQCRRNSR